MYPYLCKIYVPCQPLLWYTYSEVVDMSTSKAQLEASARYIGKLDDIKIRVPAGDRQKYRDFAAAHGYSLNALVVALLDAAMRGDVPVSPKSN